MIAFQPYRNSFTQDDILRLWQISFLYYANLVGINLTGTEVNLRHYLQWLVQNKFGIDIETIEPYTKYKTKSDVVGVHMTLASRLMLPDKQEDFTFLQYGDYELFKKNDVFLGIQTQGMFYLFSEIAGFITQSRLDEEMSEEELGRRIHNQMGFVSLGIVSENEEIVTISKNVENSIKFILQTGLQNVVILIDETLPEQGEGDTFRSIIKGLVRKFGVELVKNIKIYVANIKTFTFDTEQSVGDYYIWKEDNAIVERVIRIKKTEIMI